MLSKGTHGRYYGPTGTWKHGRAFVVTANVRVEAALFTSVPVRFTDTGEEARVAYVNIDETPDPHEVPER